MTALHARTAAAIMRAATAHQACQEMEMVEALAAARPGGEIRTTAAGTPMS